MAGGIILLRPRGSSGTGGGVTAFTQLSDVPNSYVGEGTKFLAVKASEDGIEFVAVPVGIVTSVFGRTGDVLAQANDYTWAQIDKTVSNIADITLRSHNDLVDIGTNTHAVIDTHLADTNNPHATTAVQVGAVPLVGGASIQNQIIFVDEYPIGPGTVPTLPTHLVDKAYADLLAQGFTAKEAVKTVATSNVTLSGLQTVHAYTLLDGDRVAVINNTNPVQNGIYNAHSGAWVRATDFDEDVEVQQGNSFIVTNGDLTGNGWAVASIDPIVGTDPILFFQIFAPPVYVAGDGLDLNSLTFSLDLAANQGLRILSTELAIDYDDSSIGIVTNKLAVKTGGITNAMLAGSIADSKLLTISTAGKVSGAALTSLSSIPSGAGIIPIANLASGTPSGNKFIRDDGNLAVPAGGGTVESVTGNRVDNTDPDNPIVQDPVADGVTITGSGTLADPFVASGVASSGLDVLPITGTIDDSNTTFTATEEPIILVINGISRLKTTGPLPTDQMAWGWSAGTITTSFGVGVGGFIYGLRSGTNGGGVMSTGFQIWPTDPSAPTISTGSKGYVMFKYSGTVEDWTIFSDQSGSIVIDVKKCTYGTFPTTSTIAGSEKPTLSAAQKNQDTTLSSFSTAVSAGDIWEFVVDSVSGLNRINLSFKIRKD